MAGGAHAAARLTLAYSGNLDGELEPCGCSEEGNLGGIKRQATVLDRLRAENPQLLAVSAGGLLSAEGADDQLKSAYILKGFAALGYDAIGVQWRDLAYGPEFLQQQTLPWVVSNWHDASLPPVRVIDKAGQRIAVFSWLDPDASPLRKMQGSHDLATGSPVALHRALAQAKRRGELTLLTTTLPAEGAAKLFDLEQVDILIERAGYEVYAEPRRLGRTLVLKPGSRGMRIARLDLEIADARVTGWRHQVLPMPPSIPDAPQLAAWYEEYNAAVKAAYLKVVELRKVQEDGSGPFVGAEVCAACHAQAHATWSASRHAGAYATLEAVGKAFDPGCIGCHVVGFRQPGGYFDLNLTGHLAGVQCENCHGAGRAHVESQGRTPVANRDWKPEQMCAQCHNQPHSPGFNFGTYWPKIAH
jgi:2',3'-cyclic-nucleotide 2'-phosphodiesterase (5'-nucleotidase family)